VSELLERLGIQTVKAGAEQLPVFQAAEAPRHEVKIHVADSKRAIVHETGLIGISQTTGTNSALISALQMLCRSSPMRIFSTLLTPFFYRTYPLLYHKFGNMVFFRSGNLYSLCSPGNQHYQKIIYFFIRKGRNRRSKFDSQKLLNNNFN